MTQPETADEEFPSAPLHFALRKFECDSEEELIYKTTHSYVFRSSSRRFEQPIAIKLLLTEKIPSRFREKFVSRELLIARSVDHPHLLSALEIDVFESVVIIATPFCGGGSLFNVVKTRKRLPDVEAARIFRQLIEALNYLHERNVAHRDVKLENILLTDDGDVKLIDYGFAIRQKHRRERATSQCGTKGYMAPSIVKGTPYDPFAADYYACGFVLHTLLIGGFPKRLTEQSMRAFPSEEGFFLVKALLNPSDEDRPKYKQIVACEWMKKFAPVWMCSNRPNALFEVIQDKEE